MSGDQRKLLPYEYQLIDVLGVSKEEYLAFVAQQHIYEDAKTGTVLDARNWPAVAIVLTVIGVLFQVASVLLAPKPAAPRFASQSKAQAGGQAASRDDVFAPRSGFNSAQQLASYGDPVNLVYTNTDTNPQGGVRVATSLLLSAIKSYGSCQYVQLLVLLGAGGIDRIDRSRSAFGQLALRDIPPQNYWFYFKPGSTGYLSNSDLFENTNPTPDPGAYGGASDNRFAVQWQTDGEKFDGFSHAYTPSSSNVFGIYGVVPSNITLIIRNQNGDNERTNIGTFMRDIADNPLDPNVLINEGGEYIFKLEPVNSSTGSSQLANTEAAEARRVYAQVFDMSATLKYGSAKLKVIGMNASDNIDNWMIVNLKAIKSGYPVSLPDWFVDLDQDIFERRPLSTNLKAIVRVEEASYETVSPCHIVDFAIKARVFKRISGRQSEYGTQRAQGYPSSDNGSKPRSAMFLLKFKSVSDANYTYFPGIFVVERASDIENFIHLRFNARNFGDDGLKTWQFIFEPIYEPQQEIKANPQLQQSDGNVIYHYLENGGEITRYEISEYGTGAFGGIVIEYYGVPRVSYANYPPRGVFQQPRGTHTWDLFISNADQNIQYSFDGGPEFSIAAVTEHILISYDNFPGFLDNVSLMGLAMYSGKTVQDLRSFSAFVTRGRKSRLLFTDKSDGLPQQDYLSSSPNGWANTAPDIFVDTVLDSLDGIGKYANIYSMDLQQLAKTKRFCLANNLFMDCVIAEPSSWRSFWSETAGFSLLELAKIGGQDTLIPAIPYDPSTGNISATLPISAMFNQGNILEDSYKEEFIDYGSNSQDVDVRVIYRSLESNASFARNTSVNVSLSDIEKGTALAQTIDASAYVTRKEQAILIGKLLCLVKRHSRRAIEFKTFPTDSPVFPGAYIYVELAHNSWDRIYSGIVETEGKLNTPSSIPDGTYAALTYIHGTNTSLEQPTGTQYFDSIQIQNTDSGIIATQLASRAGSLFVLGNAVTKKRVFRITEVNMDEEGEVTIRAVEHATDLDGFSQIGLGMLSDSIWRIE